MPTSSRYATISTPTGADELPCGEVDDRLYRLIPSRFPPQQLFERIAQGRDAEWAALESETNPRLKAQERLLGARIDGPPPDRFQNWNHAPFAYGARYGTRFFPPGIPALELVTDVRTALAVAVVRRERFMALTDEPPAQMDMRVLCHPVTGLFAEARNLAADAPDEARLALGRRVLGMDGVDGVRFRPVERPDGEGLAILTAEGLGRAVQGAHFRFVWNGSKVSEIYSFETGEHFPTDRLDDPDLKITR